MSANSKAAHSRTHKARDWPPHIRTYGDEHHAARERGRGALTLAQRHSASQEEEKAACDEDAAHGALAPCWRPDAASPSL